MSGNCSTDTEEVYFDSQPLDTAFNVLRHHRRRHILAILAEVESCEEDFVVTEFEPRATRSDEVTLSLYHTHFPILEEAGYIEWNRDTKIIRRGPAFDKIAPVLEILQSNQDVLPGEWPGGPQ